MKEIVFNVIVFIFFFLFSSSVYGEFSPCSFPISDLQNDVNDINNEQILSLKKKRELERYFDYFSAQVKEYDNKINDRELYSHSTRRYFQLERGHAAQMANRYGERIEELKALLIR